MQPTSSSVALFVEQAAAAAKRALFFAIVPPAARRWGPKTSLASDKMLLAPALHFDPLFLAFSAIIILYCPAHLLPFALTHYHWLTSVQAPSSHLLFRRRRILDGLMRRRFFFLYERRPRVNDDWVRRAPLGLSLPALLQTNLCLRLQQRTELLFLRLNEPFAKLSTQHLY